MFVQVSKQEIQLFPKVSAKEQPIKKQHMKERWLACCEDIQAQLFSHDAGHETYRA